MVNSRQKGAAGEREWRDVLRAAGWSDARRGQQFSGSPDSPDVVGGPPDTHCEVKRVQNLNVYKAMDQATKDAGGKMPYVAWRKNGKDWLVVLRAEDFLRLCGQPQDTTGRGPAEGALEPRVPPHCDL